MKENKVKQFLDETFGEVRAINDNGEIWFVAKDVARVLEYSSTQKVTEKVDDEDYRTSLTLTNGGMQELLVINESGLYQVIVSITKKNKERYDKARDFKRWLTKEVIPTLRKDGMYIDGEEDCKTKQELEELTQEALEWKVLRKFGIGVRKNMTGSIKSVNLTSDDKYNIYAKVTNELIYEPLFNKTASQLKSQFKVKQLRDELFTTEELKKIASQEEFVDRLIFSLKDYDKVKAIVIH